VSGSLRTRILDIAPLNNRACLPSHLALATRVRPAGRKEPGTVQLAGFAREARGARTRELRLGWHDPNKARVLLWRPSHTAAARL